MMFLALGSVGTAAFADATDSSSDPSTLPVTATSEPTTPTEAPPVQLTSDAPLELTSTPLADPGELTPSAPPEVTSAPVDAADLPVEAPPGALPDAPVEASTSASVSPTDTMASSAVAPAPGTATDPDDTVEQSVSTPETEALVGALSVLPAMNKNADGSLTTVTLEATDVSRLGTAAGYALLAGSTITNTGVSTLDGNVGLNPGTAVTGFETCPSPVPAGTNCVVLTGVQNLSNGAAAQAKADLLTAYTNLVGLEGASTCTYIETELGGQTLQSGVYCSNTGTFEITGTLTLDGPGEFIFLTGAGGTTLVTAANSQVLLTNGADACNIYFQVGSSATLGANSDFQGNILAQESISVGSGATVNGQLLALTSAVTLINDTVTSPTCATTTPPGDTGGGVIPPGDTGGGVIPPGDTGGGVIPPGDTGGGVIPPGDTGGGVIPPGDTGGGVIPPGDTGGLITPPGDTGGIITPPGDTGGVIPGDNTDGVIIIPIADVGGTAGVSTDVTGTGVGATSPTTAGLGSAAAPVSGASLGETANSETDGLANTGVSLKLQVLLIGSLLGFGSLMILLSRRIGRRTTSAIR